MIALTLTALALTGTTELETLDRAVETCARDVVNPAFAAEAKRRSGFMTGIFREQEELVAARLDLSNRRRVLREAGVTAIKGGDSETTLSLASQAIEDRQRALNDRRMLEGMRNEAMDAKRRFYLSHCATASAKDRN